jgi:hypothetical protein
MKNLLTLLLLIIVLFAVTLSCSSEGGDEKVWVYESGRIPNAEIISVTLTLKDNRNYQTGYFEISIRDITYTDALGKSDHITLQINFPKDGDDNSPRPAYNIKGSTDYVNLIKELYDIDNTSTLDYATYPGKLRINDELFENIIFQPLRKI